MEPENDSTANDRPYTRNVLSLLAEAGSKGMLVGTLIRSFSFPAELQRRNRYVNTTLSQLERRGIVARSARKEHGPYYHGVPQWRWFITSKGLEEVARGPRGTRAAARLARAEELQARVRENNIRRAALVSKAIEEGYGPATPACLRKAKVLELRQQKLSLRDVGAVFLLTPERIRQIEAGIRERPCNCQECRPDMHQPRAWPRYARMPQPGTLGELYRDWAVETQREEESPDHAPGRCLGSECPDPYHRGEAGHKIHDGEQP